jgi:ATP-dependent DNA helicase HFM1/MER3
MMHNFKVYCTVSKLQLGHVLMWLEYSFAGVAFHHAGLNASDRRKIETGFINGQIFVICCTSTLAVGINLPTHMVVIKSTVAYINKRLQEYSDLDIMQMIGRAGRPQFGNTAVSVIMTRPETMIRYQKLVTGNEILESSLHLNLIEHINAEISLGSIRDIKSAQNWLSSSFLSIRMMKNPAHYKITEELPRLDHRQKLDLICSTDIARLCEAEIVYDTDGILQCTELGKIMSQFSVKFETMKTYIGMPKGSSIAEVVSPSALDILSDRRSLRHYVAPWSLMLFGLKMTRRRS